MRSCRTASVFAMGVVVAVMAAAACREALTPEIPPVTTASPDGAPLLRGETTTAPMSSSDAGPSTSAVMAAALAEPARLDVQSPELYLGRLEGTAPVAEHSHAGPREILAGATVKDAGARDAR